MLVKAPEECVPEKFSELEGDELKKLEEKCYFYAKYVNQFYKCLEYILEEIEILLKTGYLKERSLFWLKTLG